MSWPEALVMIAAILAIVGIMWIVLRNNDE